VFIVLTVLTASQLQTAHAQRTVGTPNGNIAIAVRPSMLADGIESLAGHSVRVLQARVVGVFDPRVFLIDSETSLPPIVGHRGRVLVFVEAGMLRVPAPSLVASSVRVSGIARTLLGMQVSHEVPWPAKLTANSVERLEIHAAVLAASVTTPDGVDLLDRSVPTLAAADSRPSGR
jgi:hypothetical protein